MPFREVVVGGIKLVRQAIQSPNYVAGVSGWTINRDGTAEFSNTVIRGELFVSDVDGSYIHIYDDATGSKAVIEIRSANIGGATLDPAALSSFTSGGRPFLAIASPRKNGDTQSSIFLGAGNGTGDDLIEIFGKTVLIQSADGVTVTGPLDVGGLLTAPGGLDVAGTITYRGRLLGNSGAGSNQAGPPTTESTTSATYALVTDAAGAFAVGASVFKDLAATRLKVTLHTTDFATGTANTVARWGIRDTASGITADICRYYHNTLSDHRQMSGVQYLSGVPAGSRVICPVWRREAGTGQLNRNADDHISMIVEEVQA